ncbi:DUF1295 domain containing protein [Nitzschia inconspicua]|uniref:DUF1295 domain containing protein n=1 Tax=Nitzschia inconspicua TaxID=303405 RepID=A0A9K3Q659_9STRA|nr:DUF1295 domain containing protein [Nitzschia inconspicua]
MPTTLRSRRRWQLWFVLLILFSINAATASANVRLRGVTTSKIRIPRSKFFRKQTSGLGFLPILVQHRHYTQQKRSQFGDLAIRIRGGGSNNDQNDDSSNIQTIQISSEEAIESSNTTVTTQETTDRRSVWTAIITKTRQSVLSEGRKHQLLQHLKLWQQLAATFGPAVFTLLALQVSLRHTEQGVNPMTLYTLALLGAACGFHLFLYFITLGFALGVTLPLVVSLFVYQKQFQLSTLTLLHSIVAILWGLRLFAFLTIREYVHWPALHQKVVEVQAKMNIPIASKLLCWLVYSFFYVALMASCWSRHLQGAAAAASTEASSVWGIMGYIGLFLQSTGLMLESVADLQKSNFKSRNPFTWCNVGLWKFSSHPNYLGEGLFWWGTYLAHGFHSLLPSTLATVGLGFIMVVLKGSARSLASKQKEKYGQDPEFCDFQRSHNVFGPKHWWLRMPADGNGDDILQGTQETTTIQEVNASVSTNGFV